MKKVLFLFAFAALVSTSCKKDDEKKTYEGSFTINAKTYNVTDMYWFDVTFELGSSSSTSYSISGADAAETCNLALAFNSKTLGDKVIDQNNEVTLEIGDDTYIATSGKITVTKFDDKVASGTFDCQFVKEGTTQTMAGTGKFEAVKLSLVLDI